MNCVEERKSGYLSAGDEFKSLRIINLEESEGKCVGSEVEYLIYVKKL